MSEQLIVEKKHGWLLGILITVFRIFRGLNLLYAVYLITEDGFQAAMLLSLLTDSLMIVFAVAAFDWKKWGCFGAIILSLFIGGMNTLVALITFELVGLLVGLVVVSIGPLIMYAFYRSKKQYFE